MDRSRRTIDHAIGDVIGDGDVSHLPGAGQPLRLDDNPLTPSDQRAAQKIMRDHKVQPVWIQTGQALTENEKELLEDIAIKARQHANLRIAARSSEQLKNARNNWSRSRKRLAKRIQKHNRDVLTYNLSLPAGIAHKTILDGDALLERAMQKAERES